MIAKLVENWGRIVGSRGARRTLRAATWACLAGAALTANVTVQAESFHDLSEGKIDRFLRPPIEQIPQIGQVPMWTQVDPGKVEIFKKPTECWNPVDKLEVHLSPEADESFRQNGPQATIALGLAVRLGRK